MAKLINNEAKTRKVTYVATPTASLFHASNALYRGMLGPFGSGKSVACVMELYQRALKQEPFEGVRRTKFAIIRATHPRLRDTTLQTWKDWVPEFKPNGEPYCVINYQAPMRGHLVTDLGDGTKLDMQILFLACDSDDVVGQLQSLELTGGWINEASEITKGVLDALYARCDRYPSKMMGGATWHGVIMDTNPPDDSHWWYKLAEEERPHGFEFFKQPPGVILLPSKNKEDPPIYVANDGTHGLPAAENASNHTSGYDYWLRQTYGKTPQWIKVFLMGQYGTTLSGKPIYPEYNDDVHCAKKDLEVHRGLMLTIGIDFGRSPAASFGQLTNRGQLRIIDELCSDGMGIRQFATELLRPHMANNYPGMPYSIVTDPAGGGKDQIDEIAIIQALEECGFKAHMGTVQNFAPRREAVAAYLMRMVDGQPGFLLSPKCKVLRKGFNGHYHYRKLRTAGGDSFTNTPEKTFESHVHDSCQYLATDISNYVGQNSPSIAATQAVAQRRPVVAKSAAGWT